MLGSARAEVLSYNYGREIICEVFQPIRNRGIPKRHGETGRRTDRRTTYCGITAICVASRGKNSSEFFQSQSVGGRGPSAGP